MNENIPELILKYERKEKERLKKKKKKRKIYNINYSFIYLIFLYNKNNLIEITTKNFDSLKGEIIEIKKNSNNSLKGIVLINVIKNNQTNFLFKKLYISLLNIYTCIPINNCLNNNIKERNVSKVILNGYKNLMLNEIYEKFKKIGG
ncbi:conserved Plasmodium protein, unknown function [Plasmodium relictum]|uniref:Uncharacterized protein n=1 Tax=Plasmodium relictum TaxID=85471 RepID=A0A1J1H5P2_PLARL|nr:conserved Plasmodium protein, unknown function [Plasmodium relictum]CRH00231.1 conserved Plasmodium protein, unknown function [Plasmodium relictum]